MFGIEGGELIAIAVVALLVLGPDKLPKFAADAARFVRQMRRMATTARADVRRELGPELQGISLRDLNPKSALRKHVLDDLNLDGQPSNDAEPRRTKGSAQGGARGSAAASDVGDAAVVPPPYDPDAT